MMFSKTSNETYIFQDMSSSSVENVTFILSVISFWIFESKWTFLFEVESVNRNCKISFAKNGLALLFQKELEIISDIIQFIRRVPDIRSITVNPLP